MPTRDPTSRIVDALFAAERIGNTIDAEARLLLEALFEQIAADLRRIDPTGPALPKWRGHRQKQFLALVRKRIREAIPEWGSLVKSRLAVAGRAQAKFAEGTLIASLGSVAAEHVVTTPITQARLRAILNTDPFQGATLKEWAAGMERTTLDRISKQIKLGMVAEESLDDLVRRVRGTQHGVIRQDPTTGAFVKKGTKGAVVKPRFVGGVWQATTRDAEAVVRTAVNHINNTALHETYQANADVLEGLQVVAVIDDRTTEICIALDGTVWALDDPDLRVPGYHVGCRTVLVPVIAWKRLGLEPPADGFRFARDLSDVTEDAAKRKVSARRRTGDLGKSVKVSSSTRYGDWLKEQPVAVQNRILGRGKAKLFRDGKITLSDLIRKDLSVVPLETLAG